MTVLEFPKKDCLNCGESFFYSNSLQQTCSYRCSRELEGKKVKAREVRAEKGHGPVAGRQVDHAKETSVCHQHRLTQPKFNRMRILEELLWFRVKGLVPECISCGARYADWSCGHFKTVAARSELRYSRANTALQCNATCNCDLSGNLPGYRKGLINRFGLAVGARRMDYLDHFRGTCDWHWKDLERLRARFSARVVELERMGLAT